MYRLATSFWVSSRAPSPQGLSVAPKNQLTKERVSKKMLIFAPATPNKVARKWKLTSHVSPVNLQIHCYKIRRAGSRSTCVGYIVNTITGHATQGCRRSDAYIFPIQV